MYLPNVLNTHSKLQENEILKFRLKSGAEYACEQDSKVTVVGGDIKITKTYKGLSGEMQSVMFIDPSSIEVIIIRKIIGV